MTTRQTRSLMDALKKKFRGKVEKEAVNKKGRYRFAIQAKCFEKMRQLERQDAIWEVVDKTLPREAVLDVSMILAFAPSELIVSKT